MEPPPMTLTIYYFRRPWSRNHARDFACSIGAGTARETRAGVRPRATRVETTNRCLVLAEAQQWPHGKELIERQFTVENLSAGEAPALLEIERRDDLARHDQGLQSRRILFQRVDGGVREGVAIAVPSRFV